MKFSYRNSKLDQVKDAIATPMSVEPSTPMSVDKSTMEVATASKSLIRNDRDRFFEVVEYQKDILQYLKQLEVSFDFIPALDVCSMLSNRYSEIFDHELST